MAVWTGHARDTRPIPDQAGRPRGIACRTGRCVPLKVVAVPMPRKRPVGPAHSRRILRGPLPFAAGQLVPDDAEIAEQTRRPRCEPEQSLCQCDLWHERDDCEPIKSSQVRAVSASLPADRRRGNAGDARVRAASVPVGFGKPIPTILITAYPDDAVRERGLSAGPIGYLSKPLRRMICSLHPLGSDARP